MLTIEQTFQALADDPDQWEFLGAGNDNDVYVSKHPIREFYGIKWVLKIPDTSDSESTRKNDPARAVRKWNTLNPSLPAYLLNGAWVAPYVDAIPATDEQIMRKLFEIYRRTGNLVLDLFAAGNCLNCNGEVICVGVDVAFKDPESDISSDWRDFFTEYEDEKPKSVRATQILLYLVNTFPEAAINASYITQDVFVMLHVFLASSEPVSLEMLDFLASIDRTYGDLTPKLLCLIRYLDNKKLKHEFILQCLACPLDCLQAEVLNGHISQLSDYINARGFHGYTLLHMAVSANLETVVVQLLAMGADVNVKVSQEFSSQDGQSVMELLNIHAVNENILKALLAAQPYIPPVVPGETHFIHFAATHGLISSLEHMLNTVDVSQDTARVTQPLQMSTNRFAMFGIHAQPHQQDILRRRSLLMARDESGLTAQGCAIQANQDKAVTLLSYAQNPPTLIPLASESVAQAAAQTYGVWVVP